MGRWLNEFLIATGTYTWCKPGRWCFLLTYPGFDRTLTACSLSEIQGDRIRVRVVNPDRHQAAVIQPLQPLAQLNYEFDTHEEQPKFRLDELSEVQLKILEDVQLDPQKVLTQAQTERVRDTLRRMIAAFAENPKSPHLTHVLEARIEFKEGMQPPKHRPRRAPEEEQRLVDEHIEALRRNDQVEPSYGPYGVSRMCSACCR